MFSGWSFLLTIWPVKLKEWTAFELLSKVQTKLNPNPNPNTYTYTNTNKDCQVKELRLLWMLLSI